MEEFRKLMKEIDKQRVLPDTAILQLPTVLKEDTKKRLSEQCAVIAAQILSEAIDEVNHGSVEPLDMLVKKRL